VHILCGRVGNPEGAVPHRTNVQLADLTCHRWSLRTDFRHPQSPSVKEGAYTTKEARDQSRLATIAQLDPIRAVGRAPASAYFQRGETLTSIEQAAEQRELDLVLPTGD
jgi:hypothetical protein